MKDIRDNLNEVNISHSHAFSQVRERFKNEKTLFLLQVQSFAEYCAEKLLYFPAKATNDSPAQRTTSICSFKDSKSI